MANKSEPHERTQSNDRKQSGNSDTTQMRDREMRERHSAGKTGGKPEKKRDRMEPGKDDSQNRDVTRDGGAPSRQTSSAGEEKGQL